MKRPVSNAVEYLRDSSGEQQFRNRISDKYCFILQHQANEVKAQEMGIAIDRTYFESGVSATTDKRPALKEMMEYIRESKGRIKFIIVYNLARLTKDVDKNEITKMLAETGVQIISATEEFDKLPLDVFTYHVKGKAAIFDYLYHKPPKS